MFLLVCFVAFSLQVFGLTLLIAKNLAYSCFVTVTVVYAPLLMILWVAYLNGFEDKVKNTWKEGTKLGKTSQTIQVYEFLLLYVLNITTGGLKKLGLFYSLWCMTILYLSLSPFL